MLVTGGEAIRNGDFFTAAAAPDGAEDGDAEADPEADEEEVRHDAAAE